MIFLNCSTKSLSLKLFANLIMTCAFYFTTKNVVNSKLEFITSLFQSLEP
uniref:Uncharacterized protein n=1 Tax=Arundo donax TaxID=35708 RepID=A0A0A9H6M2_ARUDO